MNILFVVDNPKDWRFELEGVRVVGARRYLMGLEFTTEKRIKVFNLCRSYRYQSVGYYVSLLAIARGHKVIPDVETIQEMRSQSIVRLIAEDLDDLIQRSLQPIQSEKFTLSIYFGRNVAQRYDRLSLKFFNLFQAPFLRANFVKRSKWMIQNVFPIPASDVPDDHIPFVKEFASRYFTRKSRARAHRGDSRYDLAILVNPANEDPPSDERAINRFEAAAERAGFDVEIITKDDFAKISRFDALFIRETTAVNHFTYRFAQRAESEGLVVIDDPQSILRCSNKVYLAELLDAHEIPSPRTEIIHRDNYLGFLSTLTFPCILKQPDSSFSQGVLKADSPSKYITHAEQLLEGSELIIAQEFMPTEYDWRVGVIDGKPFYACKYHMAKSHWQIMNWKRKGSTRYGRVEAVPLAAAPTGALRLAQKVTRLIGNGFYGVDLKQIGRRFYVIEVNDNPSVEAGYEDAADKHNLYRTVMDSFSRRVIAEKHANRLHLNR